ncbi:MAG: hypothetical protein HC775_19210 [Hyellaceae cyanobacterium CSU_1_1]|nr:hypothetical protein [Hyellaceae cyanobacterium CSU_1_1]
MSEKITPNDGSYLGAKKSQAIKAKKIQQDFEIAWENQRGLLKKNTVKLYKDKSAIGIQWQSYIDWDNTKLIEPKRVKRTLNALGRGRFPHTANAVNNAVAIAQEIEKKIVAESFSWLDYPQWMPKTVRPVDEVKPEDKTITQWIEEYEAYYWLSRDKKDYRDDANWKKGYLRYFNRIKDWSKFPSKEIFDDVCMNHPKSVKRNECCTRIKYLAQFCGLTDYDPKDFRLTKSQIKVKAKAKRELTDTEVEAWFNKFPMMTNNNGKPSQWQLWQWMYGMQAAYGFRNHETLNIYNLDQEYRGEDGRLYPAFTDSVNNPRGIIYTEGKGVKRAAFLPHPLRWLNDFNLRNVPSEYFLFQSDISSMSDFDKAKAKVMKLHSYGNFLREHEFTFTAYNLRHHYNVKSHHAGIPASIIAKNLGHTLATPIPPKDYRTKSQI